MAGTGASSPFIKDEPDDQLFGAGHNQRFMGGNTHQQFNMPQQQFNNFGSTPGTNGSINPNDLSMPMSVQAGSYLGGGFQGNFASQPSNPNGSYSKGISALDDDDLLESLGGFQEQQNINHNGLPQNQQNFNNLEEFDFNIQTMYPGQAGSMPMEQHPQMVNVYSSTPDGDPIQSPFVHNFNHQQIRQMQQQHQQQFGSSLQSPNSFTNSPLAGELHSGSADNYMNQKQRTRPSLPMQRKPSASRGPLTPKTPSIGVGVGSMNLNGQESGSYPSQPIRTSAHRKTPSAQWEQGVGSLQSFPGSGFSSPIQAGMHPNPQIADILKSGSMPTKLNGAQSGSAPAMQTQEMKRRRRRESHNLVERRRRDNINERIQELSHLVPMHRLEDEKVRKALQNNSPSPPPLAPPASPRPKPPRASPAPAPAAPQRGISPRASPSRRKTKGDILNGSVSWTRDLMWMLHVKLQQQEELANLITDLGGTYPFEPTEDERRMQTELVDAMHKNGVSSFSYSRAPGTGLRVPKHTDIKGDPVGAARDADSSVSPAENGGRTRWRWAWGGSIG
ncbi:hypothetical protein ACLOAV_005695 [Pseudogymnoascus australis]